MRETRSSGNSQIIVTDITGFYELPYRPQKINDTDDNGKPCNIKYKKMYV